MTRRILRLMALLCATAVFTSCMFFPKEDPSQRFAGISAERPDSVDDALNDLELDDEQIFAVTVTKEASVTAETEANLFGVYPTYVLVKVRPADAKTSTVTIYRRLDAQSDEELIVDHESSTKTIFEDYNESAKAFETYEYKTILTLKNGTEVPSEWMSGYGAITPERFFFVMNDEVGSSHQKFPDFGKAKAATNNASGYISGSAQYQVQIKGLGGTAYITYDNYCDYRLHITGSSNTDSDMSGNGDMYGTLVASGMYHGSCNYDDIDIRSKNAAGGTYLVQTAGVAKRLIYNIQDRTPSRVNVISLTASTNTEPQEGEVPNILGVYPITLTWEVPEDMIAGSTVQIFRRTMDETAGKCIYSAPASDGSQYVDTFTEENPQQPQTFYQYQAYLYKDGNLQGKTRWETGCGFLPPLTMTVTASQGTAVEGYEPNRYGIYPITVSFSVEADSALLENATYSLIRRLKDDNATRTELYRGSESSQDLVDVNEDAMFGQTFEYRIEITNEAGQLLRYSDWAEGYGDRLPLAMNLNVSDNSDILETLTPNRFGAYPVTLQYSVTSLDESLTDPQFTLLRRNEESGAEESLYTEAVADSTGMFTDTTADARRLTNRTWSYAVELKSGDLLMYRTDWISVEPVLVPATLEFTASDNRENEAVQPDRFGVTPVTLNWNWSSNVPFLNEGSYVKLYYKLPDDLNGTQLKEAPAGLSGTYELPVTTDAYQYKADLVTPNGKKTVTVATTGWTDAVTPYVIPFGFDYLSVSNNENNLNLEPNQYGINPFTVSWKWHSEKPFLREGSYLTLTRKDADGNETVVLSKADGNTGLESTCEDLIADAKRDSNRTFSWKADLYTAEDELLSTTGWSDICTAWIIPVNCSLTVSKVRVTEDMPEPNRNGVYPVFLDFSMNDFYYTHSTVTIDRRKKSGEGTYETFELTLDNENHGAYETEYATVEPATLYEYRATVKSLDGATIKETEWQTGYGAVDPAVFFTEWLETLDAGLSKTTKLWHDYYVAFLKFPKGSGDKSGTVVYRTHMGYTSPEVIFENYQDKDVILDGTFGFNGETITNTYKAKDSKLTVTNAKSGYNGQIGFEGMWYKYEVDRPEGYYTAIIGDFKQQYTQDGQMVITE